MKTSTIKKTLWHLASLDGENTSVLERTFHSSRSSVIRSWQGNNDDNKILDGSEQQLQHDAASEVPHTHTLDWKCINEVIRWE